MFPFPQLSLKKCPLCGDQLSNIHLALDCMSIPAQEAKEQGYDMLEAEMNNAELHGIPKKWKDYWLDLSQREKIIALIQAPVSPEKSFWIMISEILDSMWKRVKAAVEEAKEENDLLIDS